MAVQEQSQRSTGRVGSATRKSRYCLTSRRASKTQPWRSAPRRVPTPAQVRFLTERLHEQARNYPRDPSGVPRTGAAGGFSGGMWSYFGAEPVSGSRLRPRPPRLPGRAVRDVTAVVVGEGRLDSETQNGKIISAVLARVGSKPVFAVAGSVNPELGDYAERFDEILVASDPAAMTAAGARVTERVRHR